jgi:hypothetical protein
MAPKEHTIPGTYECVTLNGKRDFEDVIKDLELGKKDYLGFFGSPLDPKVPFFFFLIFSLTGSSYVA